MIEILRGSNPDPRILKLHEREQELRQVQSKAGQEIVELAREANLIRLEIVAQGIREGLTKAEMARRAGLHPKRLEFQTTYLMAKARVDHEAR